MCESVVRARLVCVCVTMLSVKELCVCGNVVCLCVCDNVVRACVCVTMLCVCVCERVVCMCDNVVSV